MIQRKPRAGLKRSTTPIPKKRAKKRAWKSPRCIYETPTGRRTCTKPQAHIERCPTHADWYLDGLVREIVDRQVARAKEKVRRELAKLPDDDSRRRVIVATAALLGFPVCTKDEHR